MLLLDALQAAEVTEARIVVELEIVRLVCERATEGDIHALTESCDRSDAALAAGTYSMDLSTEFHVCLATSTHNRALDLIVGSFRSALRESLHQASAVAPVMGPEGVGEHRAVVAAIAARDPEAARAVLEPHLHRTAARQRAALAGEDPDAARLTP